MRYLTMVHKLASALTVLLLVSGCDTTSLYSARDYKGELTDAPTESMRSRQQLVLDNGLIIARIYASRFNFTMGVYLELENKGSTSLQFVPWNALMAGGYAKSLPLKTVSRKSEKKYEPINDEGTVLEVAPETSERFLYNFDGTPVMGFTHIFQTEVQKTLHLKLSGLQRAQTKIPFDLTFDQIEKVNTNEAPNPDACACKVIPVGDFPVGAPLPQPACETRATCERLHPGIKIPSGESVWVSF
jgi:hypothetical protein